MALPFNITPVSILSAGATALDLIGIGLNVDVVAVYDSETLRQVFNDARPTKAIVREYSKVMDHPVETGVTLSDHHIIMPTQIELALVIPARFYSSTYQQIRGAFIAATKLSVQTKTGVYPNMIIAELPHQEDPEMYDAITMGLRMREVIFVAPSSIAQPNSPANYSPTDPQNENVILRGQQSRLLVTLPASILGYVNAIYAWGR